MNIPLARQLTEQLALALADDPVVPPPPPPPISTTEAFDLAYHAAAPGAELLLDPSLRYDHALTIDKTITLRSTQPFRMGSSITRDEPAPVFTSGMTVTGLDVRLIGIEVRHSNPLSTILNVAGEHAQLERVRVLGDATLGAKRGINYTGSGASHIVDSYVDNIFQPAQDTQAIYSDNMGDGTLLIDNCYLAAAGEVVMFGGGDAPAGRDPHDVTLTNSVLDKKAEWTVFDAPDHHTQQTKCSLELKNMRRFYSSGCTFIRGGGISQGQGGYAFDLTPRNQSGGNPTAAVQGVLIENFTIIAPGSGVASISGQDTVHPSEKLRNVVIRKGLVRGVDHNALSSTRTTGRLFTFDHAPERVTLDDITISGVGIKSICYFQGLQPPTELVLSGLTVDNGGVAIPYRYKLDGNTHAAGFSWPMATQAALLAYMPDAQLGADII